MKKYNQQAAQILVDAREKADRIFDTQIQINLNRQLAPLSPETRLKFLKEKEEIAVKEYEKMCRAWFLYDFEQGSDEEWIERLDAYLHDAASGIKPIPPTNEVKYPWSDIPEERVKSISRALTGLLANRMGYRRYQYHLADLIKLETDFPKEMSGKAGQPAHNPPIPKKFETLFAEIDSGLEPKVRELILAYNEQGEAIPSYDITSEEIIVSLTHNCLEIAKDFKENLIKIGREANDQLQQEAIRKKEQELADELERVSKAEKWRTVPRWIEIDEQGNETRKAGDKTPNSRAHMYAFVRFHTTVFVEFRIWLLSLEEKFFQGELKIPSHELLSVTQEEKVDRLTNSNTVVFVAMLFSIPPNERDKKRFAERGELMDNIRKEGKTMTTVCCDSTAEILRGALEIGMSKDEWSVFVHSFNQHLLTDFNNYELKGKGEVNIIEMVDKVFESVDLLNSPQLSAYFLDSVFRDVMEGGSNGSPCWDIAKMKFKKEFQKRKDDFLRSRGLGIPPETAKENTLAQLNFEAIFVEPELAQRVEGVLQQMGLVSETLKWIGKKTEIGVLVDVLNKRGYLREKWPDEKIVPLIAAKFQISIGSRSTRNRPKNFDELKKNLTALLPKLP